MNRKILTALIVLSLLSSLLFASGAKEKGVEFSSLDLGKATVSEITGAWNDTVNYYNFQKESLEKAMGDSYAKKDVEDYLALRSLYHSLEEPVITKEETETLASRFASLSEGERAELAAFLSSNSAYYRPVLTLRYETASSRTVRRYAMTPGKTVVLPSLATDGEFKGWMAEDGTLYEAGAEIPFPYADTTLVASVVSGIRFTDSVTGYSSFVEGTAASLPALEAPSEELVFKGWYNGGVKAEDEAVTEEGKSVTYKAEWKGISFLGAGDDHEIPAGSKAVISMRIENTGNTAIKGIKVTLEAGDGGTVLSGGKTISISAGKKASSSFIIGVEGESGDTVVFTAKAEDRDGNVWREDYILVLK